jgi:tetratricopeptide (TPR) repeat protein
MDKSRSKVLWMVVALLLAIGPIATLLGSSAAAQSGNHMSGTVYNPDGKPYESVTLVFTNADTHQVFSVTADAKGRYSTPGFASGTWNIDVKDQTGTVVYQTSVKIGGGQDATLDIKVVVSEEQKKQKAEQQNFANMKTHFDAGVAAYTQGLGVQKQLAQATADQKDALQAQLGQFAETAVTEFQGALAALPATDTNRHIILYRVAQSYELEDKDDQAITFYQQSIAAFPPPNGPSHDLAASYNNLGNDLAKVGKTDDAMAAYQKAADADPPNAASAWRNAGATLYNAGKMADAIVPFQKAVALDPKNAQTWYLLGTCLMNTMSSKTEGDKVIPIISPGTVEAFQKAVELDPNGPWGAQSKQALDALQAMGAGIDTKYKAKGKS